MTATATAAPSSPGVKPRPKGLHIALWVVQVVLGLGFAFAGFTKATQPFGDLWVMMPWTTVVPWWLVRFIGIAELAGGLGLILPAASRIQPRLTPLAAAGLGLVMVLAAGFHLMRGEYTIIPMNVVAAAVAGFVAWGRWVRAPIDPR